MSCAIIEPFLESHLSKVKNFTDQEIGQNYYSLDQLQKVYNQSVKKGFNYSFVLLANEEVQGVRFTFPPGQWTAGKGKHLSEKLWPFPKSQTAYFQSLFISKNFRGQGWGRKLSEKSLVLLKQNSTLGVVCHSWKESPQDSSGGYLRALGFKKIAEYPKYWSQVQYQCPLCQASCQCTAEEMYLVL